MQNTSRTVEGARFQAAKIYNHDIEPTPEAKLSTILGSNTTLGATYNDEKYKVDYFVFGNNGYSDSQNPSVRDGDDDVPVIFNGHRDPSAASLYNMIPLLALPSGAQPDAELAEKYCLRSLESIGGTLHTFYYGIKSDSITPPREYWLNIYTGEESDTSKSMYDTTPTRVNDTEEVSNEAVVVSTVMNLRLTVDVLDKLKEACIVKYGSDDHDVINEVGICAGYEVSSTNVTDLVLMSSVNTTETLGIGLSPGGVLSVETGSLDNFLIKS